MIGYCMKLSYHGVPFKKLKCMDYGANSLITLEQYYSLGKILGQ